MKKQSFFAFGAMMLLMGSVVACGDKDKEFEGDLDDQGSGSMEVMSPTESKNFLETTAKEFIGYFNPNDQKQVIQLCDYFLDEYGDLDAPKEFEIEEDEDYYSNAWESPAKIIKAMRQLAKNANGPSMAKELYTYTYTINFDRFKGVYQPGTYSWQRVSDSDDIVFRFAGPNDEQCEAKVSASGSTSNAEVTYDDTWFDYWDNMEYTDRYIYKISVPKTLTATLTQDRETLANAKVETDVDYKGHKYTATVTATVANIQASVTSNGDDSHLYQATGVWVSGTQIVNCTAEVKGYNLCNVDKIIDGFENDFEDYKLTNWFTTGSAKVNVLDKVQVYADVTFKDSFVDADDSWGYWDYDSRNEAYQEAQRVADIFNNNIDAKVRYNNKATDQATFQVQPVLDKWGSSDQYWEYYLEPVLYFPQDKTTYTFEEYFEKGFESLEKQWNSLIDSYERLWK